MRLKRVAVFLHPLYNAQKDMSYINDQSTIEIVVALCRIFLLPPQNGKY